VGFMVDFLAGHYACNKVGPAVKRFLVKARLIVERRSGGGDDDDDDDEDDDGDVSISGGCGGGDGGGGHFGGAVPCDPGPRYRLVE